MLPCTCVEVSCRRKNMFWQCDKPHFFGNMKGKMKINFGDVTTPNFFGNVSFWRCDPSPNERACLQQSAARQKEAKYV